MITREQYFNGKPHLPEHADAAHDLLGKVNAMLLYLGWSYPIDKDTGTSISGDAKKGNGDGGFRLSIEPGATKSLHKTAHAVDVYDPHNKLDDTLTDELLEKFGLYREHPAYTKGWCHLQDMPPKSKNRTYYP